MERRAILCQAACAKNSVRRAVNQTQIIQPKLRLREFSFCDWLLLQTLLSHRKMASFTLFRPKPMVRKSTMMERGCRYFEFPSHSKYKSIQTFIHRFFERWNDCGAIGVRYEALFAPNKTNFCLWRRTRCHSIRFGVPKKGAERVCDFFIRPRVVRTLRKPQWRSRRFLVTKPESF